MKAFLLAVAGCIAIALAAALVLTNIDTSVSRKGAAESVRLN